MAEQLVEAMAGDFQPDLFHDEFREKLMELVEQKAREGGLQAVQPLPGEEVESASAEVIDLTELLRRSLKGGGAERARKPAARGQAAAANDEAAPVRKAAARKTSTTARAAVKAAPRRKSS
jgi:DNA end-binding protein Ku